MSALLATSGPGVPVAAHAVVTVTLAGQEVAVPVACVQDILDGQPLTPVPRAYPEIAGLLNLRGRIVTAVDLRRRLGLEPAPADAPPMNVVIDHAGELYSLLVDSVGDVLDAPHDALDRDTSLLGPAWRGIATGIYALESRLLVAVEIDRILDSAAPRLAALEGGMTDCLIVDDSATVRRVLRRMLERLSCRIAEADSGTAALAACQQHPPGLIMLDWQMPGMDGLSFCGRCGDSPAATGRW